LVDSQARVSVDVAPRSMIFLKGSCLGRRSIANENQFRTFLVHLAELATQLRGGFQTVQSTEVTYEYKQDGPVSS
jgi:hypothetical protein